MVAAKLISSSTKMAAKVKVGGCHQQASFFDNVNIIDNIPTDGPLRRLDDPENASFLESIRKSECPKELEPADRRSSVHDNLTRRDQNCPAWGCSELSAAVDGIPSEASYLSNSQKIEQADLSSLVVIQKL
nr:plant UBX domain-containing protein 3-like [Populus alba]